MLISDIVLNHQNRANAALFTAQMRFEICIINITTVILLRRGIHCASFLSFRSVGTPLVFDWLPEGIVILGICSRRLPAEHGTSHHCRFLRFGHAIGSIQSSCTFFGGSVLRVYIRGRVTFFALGDDNQFPGGFQGAETAGREGLPQRNDVLAAVALVFFRELADVVEVIPPVAGCLKMVVVNVAASCLSNISVLCKVPNFIAILYPEQLFVIRIDESDALLCVLQMLVKPVPAIAVAIQVVFASLGIEAENVGVFICVSPERQLPAIEVMTLAVRVLMAVRREGCSAGKNGLYGCRCGCHFQTRRTGQYPQPEYS